MILHPGRKQLLPKTEALNKAEFVMLLKLFGYCE